jgi:hypothetical protein
MLIVQMLQELGERCTDTKNLRLCIGSCELKETASTLGSYDCRSSRVFEIQIVYLTVGLTRLWVFTFFFLGGIPRYRTWYKSENRGLALSSSSSSPSRPL